MQKGKVIAILSDTAGMCAACKMPITGEKKPIRRGYVECIQIGKHYYHKKCAGIKDDLRNS